MLRSVSSTAKALGAVMVTAWLGGACSSGDKDFFSPPGGAGDAAVTAGASGTGGVGGSGGTGGAPPGSGGAGGSAGDTSGSGGTGGIAGAEIGGTGGSIESGGAGGSGATGGDSSSGGAGTGGTDSTGGKVATAGTDASGGLGGGAGIGGATGGAGDGAGGVTAGSGGTDTGGQSGSAGAAMAGAGSGGTPGHACSDHGDCAEDGEYCFKASCAAETGECKPRPASCTGADAEFSPGCGCDGMTYYSPCVAAREGVSLSATGECDDNDAATCTREEGGDSCSPTRKNARCYRPRENCVGPGSPARGVCWVLPDECPDEEKSQRYCGGTSGDAECIGLCEVLEREDSFLRDPGNCPE